MFVRVLLSASLFVVCGAVVLACSYGAFTGLLESVSHLGREWQREAALDAAAETALAANARRQAARAAAMRGVLAGRLTLWEGASQFKAANVGWDGVHERMYR